MRFFFLLFFLILSIVSLIAINSISGLLLTTPGCQSGCTPVFYRTVQEKADVEKMYYDAGFAIMGYGPAPASFTKSGYYEFACACPRPKKELNQVQLLPRESVITKLKK